MSTTPNIGLTVDVNQNTTTVPGFVDITETNMGLIDTAVGGIQELIPSQATSSNQLADKAFVNSSISTNTANFIGTFESVSLLRAYSGTVTNNDYAFVRNTVVQYNGGDFPDTTTLNAYDKTLLTNGDYAWVVNAEDNTKYDLYRFDIVNQIWVLRATKIAKSLDVLNGVFNRYKASVSGTPATVTWAYEYTLNNSSFTAAQWEAINSGITSGLTNQITTNQTAITGIKDGTTINSFSGVESALSGKQDTLVGSGTGQNIKTINGNNLLGSGNIDIKTFQPFPSSWSSSTSGTTKAFCDVVNADTSAVVGMAYLGGVSFSDLPFNGNGDLVVEIQTGPNSSKVVHLILTSGNVEPYRWEYTYWNNGTNVSGWVGFQPELVSGTNIKTINGNSILGSGDITVATQGGVTALQIEGESSTLDPDLNGVVTIPAEEPDTIDLAEATATPIVSSLTQNGTSIPTDGAVYAALEPKQNSTDNSLTTTSKTIVGAINEVDSVAKQANKALGYSDYSALILALNLASATDFKVGQSLYVQTQEVPDLWIMSVESSSVTYTYTTDAAFVSATGAVGGCQVGYYKLAQLETQKVDLSNYATIDEVNNQFIKYSATVGTADWTLDNNITNGFVYYATINVTGTTATSMVSVSFSPADAMSGNFSPECESISGGVKIYAKTNPIGDTPITIYVWGNYDIQGNNASIAIDQTPTSGSANAVSSGGVYSALGTKIDTPSVAGSNGDVLTLSSGVPTWSAPSGGANSVIAEGTSGNWKYRKWSNGECELWLKTTKTSSTWSTWGSLYIATVNSATDYPYPFTFSSAPVEVCTMTADSALTFIPCTDQKNSSTYAGAYSIVRGTTSSAVSVVINLYVKGTLSS